MQYSSLTQRITGQGSDAWITHDLAVERLARGDDIILLSIGDPDFDTPAPIRRALVDSIARGRTHYSPIGGEPELRVAIAETTGALLHQAVDPEQVVVFPGAQAALFALAQCLFQAGDEVIVPEPAYVTYEAVLGASGAVMRHIPLRPANGFHLDPNDLAAAITPRTRGVLLNFPHNPTGATLTPAEAQAVAELCRKHDLVLISDEVYAALSFGAPFESPASLAGMAERTAVVSSLSKSHAMTGWRCGWTVTSLPLAQHLINLARCMYFGIAQFVQDAATAALQDSSSELAMIRSSYADRAQQMGTHLASVPGLRCRIPEAGMYLFLDVRDTGLDGIEFARGLLQATGVAVTPGEGFGPSGAGHVRITLGTGDERLREAATRIERFARGLSRD